MALTITSGESLRRLATIAATPSIAAALSTEVPPNFMTIMLALRSLSVLSSRRQTKSAHKRKTHQPLFPTWLWVLSE
jgi:hypothetical protein